MSFERDVIEGGIQAKVTVQEQDIQVRQRDQVQRAGRGPGSGFGKVATAHKKIR